MENTKRSLIDEIHYNDIKDEEEDTGEDGSVTKRSKRHRTPLTGIAVVVDFIKQNKVRKISNIQFVLKTLNFLSQYIL